MSSGRLVHRSRQRPTICNDAVTVSSTDYTFKCHVLVNLPLLCHPVCDRAQAQRCLTGWGVLLCTRSIWTALQLPPALLLHAHPSYMLACVAALLVAPTAPSTLRALSPQSPCLKGMHIVTVWPPQLHLSTIVRARQHRLANRAGAARPDIVACAAVITYMSHPHVQQGCCKSKRLSLDIAA